LQRRRTLIIFLSAQQVLLLSPAFRNYRQNKTQYQRITELETEKQLLAAEAVKGKSRNEPAWQKTCMMDWEA
jgi:CRISPR/Cas system-associated endonuclease Cas1